MPLHIISQIASQGFGSIPGSGTILKYSLWIIIVYLLKRYFGGAHNMADRILHSKVIMITGGTSGIGAIITRELATRGAQIILLTHYCLTDPFLVEFIEDLRESTSNNQITAEHVDLADLLSIRSFATRWLDNLPPRRLDMVILCAATNSRKFHRIFESPPQLSTSKSNSGTGIPKSEEVNVCWGVNYLANFHLLTLLKPALLAQPSGRDVRVIVATCTAYLKGRFPTFIAAKPSPVTPCSLDVNPHSNSASHKKETPFECHSILSADYATSKLALMTFAMKLQRTFMDYARPDKMPCLVKVLLVDPGFVRTAGMREYLTFSSLWGLLLYLITYPIWWLILKSPLQGAQTFLYAAMSENFAHTSPAMYLKECKSARLMRSEIIDGEVQDKLWKTSEFTINSLEKSEAHRRTSQNFPRKPKAA